MNERFDFDELARDLARGVSRREALWRVAGGLAGAVLASLGLGKTWGQVGNSGRGSDECASFCETVFRPGSARGQCINDAAHGKGLCFECGPASAGEKVLCGTICCETVCCAEVCCPVLTPDCCSNVCTN